MSDPLAVLQRIRDIRPRAETPQEERCELCAEPIPESHGHLVDLASRGLRCACRGCYLLFTSEGAGGAHFRAVPERYLALDVRLAPEQWESLQIPVSVAFFFYNSTLGRTAAFYPSPAGATESELALDTWDDLVEASPELATLEPDVEALLVRADPRRSGAECFVVPIDACYELVGNLRLLWRGFDGGSEANAAIDSFFEQARARAR